MLTSEKIEVFKSYKGYYDGYHFQNNSIEKIISDDEWFLISNLMQDLHLIRMNLCSKSFENLVNELLLKNCDAKETIKLIFELEKFLNEQS